MMTLSNYLTESENVNEAQNKKLTYRGVALNPCSYMGEPCILIGEPIKFHETKMIDLYMSTARSLGMHPDSLSTMFADNDIAPAEEDFYGLVYSLVDGRYPEIAWMDMNSVEYEF